MPCSCCCSHKKKKDQNHKKRLKASQSRRAHVNNGCIIYMLPVLLSSLSSSLILMIIIIIILVVVISENFIISSMNYCHTVFCTNQKKRPVEKKETFVCVFVLKRTLFTFLNVSSPPLQTTPKRRISTPTSFDDDARAHISIVSFHRVY